MHDYTNADQGHDYIFEPINGGIRGYMTGQEKSVKRGDYVILQNGSKSSRYQVENVDYYSNPSDMWLGLLKESK